MCPLILILLDYIFQQLILQLWNVVATIVYSYMINVHIY